MEQINQTVDALKSVISQDYDIGDVLQDIADPIQWLLELVEEDRLTPDNTERHSRLVTATLSMMTAAVTRLQQVGVEVERRKREAKPAAKKGKGKGRKGQGVRQNAAADESDPDMEAMMFLLSLKEIGEIFEGFPCEEAGVFALRLLQVAQHNIGSKYEFTLLGQCSQAPFLFDAKAVVTKYPEVLTELFKTALIKLSYFSDREENPEDDFLTGDFICIDDLFIIYLRGYGDS